MVPSRSGRLINKHPGPAAGRLLALVPFALLLIAYVIGSEIRLSENPNDKLLPSFTALSDAVERMAFEPDKRTGDYLLWVDTAASLSRLIGGVTLATLMGTVIGISVGLIPYARRTMSAFIAVFAMIPPLAVLPILFITFGLGEVAKVVLIVFGIAPFMMRDLALRVSELPPEQLVKAQTLGASTWHIAWRIVLPQMLPRIIDTVRLSLGSAWLFLIAAEAIAAQSGLGYRIFLLRRYLAMDVILPYVFWITLLAVVFDFVLRRYQTWAYPWFAAERAPG
jgi:NitT/TauT family transport system permease protein